MLYSFHYDMRQPEHVMPTRTADMSVRSIRTIWPIHPTNASRTKSQNLSRCILCRHRSVRLVPAKADSPLRFRTVTPHLTGNRVSVDWASQGQAAAAAKELLAFLSAPQAPATYRKSLLEWAIEDGRAAQRD